jgi:hypothetical protein
MIKALLLVFEPIETWERIFRAQRSFSFVLWRHLVPMLLLGCLVEGFGLHRWGKWQHDALRLKQFEVGEAVMFELAQLVIGLLVVFVAAKLLKSLGDTFHGRHTFLQSFTVAAYGLSPIFTIRVLDAFPAVSPWLTWPVGMIFVAGVLYQGIPRVMMPDPPHAFGLYLMSTVLLIVLTGLTRFVTAWYLQGRFKPVETILHDAGRWLFS